MVNVPPEFESRDNIGITYQFTTSVGTTPILLPSNPDKPIEEFLIIAGNNGDKKIQVSCDNGNNWIPILSNGHLIWSLKKNSSGAFIYQLKLKGDSEDLSCFGLINFAAS